MRRREEKKATARLSTSCSCCSQPVDFLSNHIMESLLALTGKDFALIAADTNSARSIVVMKRGEDKTRDLNRHTVMAFSGEPGDAVNFAEYIQRNISLYEIRNGIALSPDGLAHFIRREMADSLRSRVGSRVSDVSMARNGSRNTAMHHLESRWIFGARQRVFHRGIEPAFYVSRTRL